MKSTFLFFTFLFSCALNLSAALIITKGTFPNTCNVSGVYASQIDPILITETLSNDFNCAAVGGTYTYILEAPIGFEFMPGMGAIEDYPAGTGSDFDDNISIHVTRSSLIISVTADNTLNNSVDQLVITGLRIRGVRASSTITGFITRTGGTLATNPVVVSSSHADLTAVNIYYDIPTIANVSRCGAGNMTFIPSAPIGNSFNIYDQETGGTLLNSGTTLIVGNSSTQTYYITSAYTGGCESSIRVPVTGIINQPILIQVQPQDKTVCENSHANYIISATGSNITYQWQQNPGTGIFAAISDGSQFFGTNSPTLIIQDPLLNSNGYQYRCVLSGPCNTVTSTNATLTIIPKPSISLQPFSVEACIGSNITFSISSSNTISYQWQYLTGTNWINLTDNLTYSGTTSSELTINNVQQTFDKTNYQCIASGQCSYFEKSNPALLTTKQFCIETNGFNTKYCINDDSSLLIGSPANGVFTGTGIVQHGLDYWFKPSLIGSFGNTSITYTYIDAGCTFIDTESTILLNDCEVIPSNPLPISQYQNKKNIQQETGDSFVVYPNPSTETIHLDSKNKEDFIRFTLLNAQGIEVWESIKTENSIDVSRFPKGSYTLLLTSKTTSQRKKIILE